MLMMKGEHYRKMLAQLTDRERQSIRTRRITSQMAIVAQAETFAEALLICRTGRFSVEPDFRREKPCQPTDALPGSAAKVEVLRMRLARGESLWHPDDATGEKSL